MKTRYCADDMGGLPTLYKSPEAWRDAGRQLFGEDSDAWRFICPACGHVATVGDWIRAGGAGMAAFSCIGRLMGGDVREAFGTSGPGPCNYAGGGLFGLNPVTVLVESEIRERVFQFAPADVRVVYIDEGGTNG